MRTDQIEAYVDAAAAALGLNIADEHKPGVRGYVALAALMAEQVHGLPLGIEDEAAPQFVPVEPPSLLTRTTHPAR